MTWNSHASLSVAQLVVFVPSLFLGLYLVFKNGRNQKSAWYFTTVLSLIRTVGACITIASTQVTDPSTVKTLTIVGAVLSAAGVSAFISSILSLLSRVNEGLTCGPILPPRILRLIHVVGLVALILGSLGASGMSQSNQTPDDMQTHESEYKAAIAIFLIQVITLLGLLGLLVTRHKQAKAGERRILIAVAAAWPFLLVRVIYSMCVAFSPSSVFNMQNPNIYVEAFMASLEEFIVVGIIVALGFLVVSSQPSTMPGKNVEASYQMLDHGVPQYQAPSYDPRSGYESYRHADPAAGRLTPSPVPANRF